MQDIEKKLEKNAEERAEILQRICANKTAGEQKDGDIESEIADVKNSQEELARPSTTPLGPRSRDGRCQRGYSEPPLTEPEGGDRPGED